MIYIKNVMNPVKLNKPKDIPITRLRHTLNQKTLSRHESFESSVIKSKEKRLYKEIYTLLILYHS